MVSAAALPTWPPSTPAMRESITSWTPTTAMVRSRAQGHGDFGTIVAAVGKAYDMELSPDHRNRPIGINADGVGSRRCGCPSHTAALCISRPLAELRHAQPERQDEGVLHSIGKSA